MSLGNYSGIQSLTCISHYRTNVTSPNFHAMVIERTVGGGLSPDCGGAFWRIGA